MNYSTHEMRIFFPQCFFCSVCMHGCPSHPLDDRGYGMRRRTTSTSTNTRAGAVRGGNQEEERLNDFDDYDYDADAYDAYDDGSWDPDKYGADHYDGGKYDAQTYDGESERSSQLRQLLYAMYQVCSLFTGSILTIELVEIMFWGELLSRLISSMSKWFY